MSHHTDSSWVTTFVFIGGFIVGAGAAFLFTPEPGSVLRERIAKGAKTAQDELTSAATEAREAVGGIANEAQRTMKRTASRLNTVLDATKEALTAEPEKPQQEPV